MLTADELRRMREAALAESAGPMRVARLKLVTYLCDHAAEIEEALRDRERMDTMEKCECWLGMKSAAHGDIKPAKLGGGLYSKSVRQCADELAASIAARKDGA